MQNSVKEVALRANPITFFSKLFNIAPGQWTRVAECWFITFFFKVGSAVGVTILTSAFIGRFGITALPIFFIISAVLIIISTLAFENLIMRVRREVLMMGMLFFAALLLFAATFYYDRSPYLFFAITIVAESIFLAQFNIFIPILVGDRFTPLESQSTFPFIESGETIGGIIGGTLLAFFGAHLPVIWFVYIWIGLLALSMSVFIITSFVRTTLPRLPTNHAAATGKRSELREVITSMRKMTFLRSLVLIVLMQWVFMNFLDFQFTKSVEQTVVNSKEPTIAQTHNTKTSDYGLASTLLAAEPVENSTEHIETNAVNSDESERKLTTEEQAQLAGKLGKIRSSFHIAALIVQALIATRLISSMGVVGSMLIHPIIMLMSLVGMFLKFGVVSSTITRMNFEVTNVVHKNAYFTSHYALPRSIRDQAAQFLEGIARPLGTVLGMSFILGLQYIFTPKNVSASIHIVMAIIMFFVFIATLKLQTSYTGITREQLFSDLPYPEKLNAIEILAQRGHKDAPGILIEKLISNDGCEGTSIVKIKILSALGEFSDYKTLPEILDSLNDANPAVRLEAANALLNFKHVGDKFYSQSFSRYRMLETLKNTFIKEKFKAVRSAIIKVFSIMGQAEIVPFLLEQLNHENPSNRSDCIHTLGLFKDPNAAHYILPALKDPESKVRASAIIALWQFPKYRAMLEKQLEELLASSDPDEHLAGMYVLGEVQHPNHRILLSYLTDPNHEKAVQASFALTKCGVPEGFLFLLDYLLSLPYDEFDSVRLFLDRLHKDARAMVEHVIIHLISLEMSKLMNLKNINSIEDIDTATLEKLSRYYTIIGQHEELFEFEKALKERRAGAN